MFSHEVVETIVMLGFFVGGGTFMFLYAYNWKKLKDAYQKINGRPLGPTQQELHDTAKKDVIAGYKMIFDGMSVGSWVLFKMKTDNPELRRPLKGIRMSLLAFVLLPFVLAGFSIIAVVWNPENFVGKEAQTYVNIDTNMNMKYDDASWHYEGDFPEDLPEIQGAVMPGMFLAWAMFNNLVSERNMPEQTSWADQLMKRAITPAEYLMNESDGKLFDVDLNELGNKFAIYYYGDPEQATGNLYVSDYDELFNAVGPTLYHVPNTWESYDKLAPILDKRFEDWKKENGIQDN